VTLALSLPFHVYGYVDKAFLSGDLKQGWEAAIWFGVTLPRNRAIGLTVLLENGAQYRELPSHAWAFANVAPKWTLKDAEAWDCFGGAAQLIEYSYLTDVQVQTSIRGLIGNYLFTLEWGDNGFSKFPPQSKTLHALQLRNQRLTWQPNDRLRWHDPSFTKGSDITWLRRQTEVWGVEEL
jgi:hypothetical protein